MAIIDEIYINAHSSILIKDNYTIRIDPYMLPSVTHDADILMITHPHYDHFSPSDIHKVMKDGTLVIGPDSCRQEIYRVSSNTVFMKPGDSIDELGIHIKALSSYNKSKEFHLKSANYLGFLITIDNDGSMI